MPGDRCLPTSGPPKPLPNSRNLHRNQGRIGNRAISQQLQLAKISSSVQLDNTTCKRCAVAFVQPWLIDRRMPLDESPAALCAAPNEVAHPNADQAQVSLVSEIRRGTASAAVSRVKLWVLEEGPAASNQDFARSSKLQLAHPWAIFCVLLSYKSH